MNELLPYTIRPMEPGDVQAVIGIEKLSYPTPWSPSAYLYELKHNPRSAYYVLLRPAPAQTAPPVRGWRRWLNSLLGLPGESRVIGYVGFRLQPAEAHITTIAVHPEWRGKGLGELLLLDAIERAVELQVSLVSLEVRASNQVAQNMYRKCGFRFRNTRPGYYQDGEDAWLMEVGVSGAAYQAQLREQRLALEAQLRRPQQDVGQVNEDTM